MPSERRESCTTLARVPTACEVLRTGIVHHRGPLGGQDQQPFRLPGLLQGAHALVAFHEDGSEHPREEDEVARS